jgi:hypothetical protein
VENNGKSPRDQAMELLVYAPIGLALEARELLPKLVERGRGQVVMAQLIGRVAADRGRAGLAKNVGRVGATSPAAAGGARLRPVSSPVEAASVTNASSRSSDVDAVLPGYDDLPAADVVRELADLDPAGLEVVRRYEQEHRRRITILNKIDRLTQS